jgi:hypothetical protein
MDGALTGGSGCHRCPRRPAAGSPGWTATAAAAQAPGAWCPGARAAGLPTAPSGASPAPLRGQERRRGGACRPSLPAGWRPLRVLAAPDGRRVRASVRAAAARPRWQAPAGYSAPRMLRWVGRPARRMLRWVGRPARRMLRWVGRPARRMLRWVGRPARRTASVTPASAPQGYLPDSPPRPRRARRSASRVPCSGHDHGCRDGCQRIVDGDLRRVTARPGRGAATPAWARAAGCASTHRT